MKYKDKGKRTVATCQCYCIPDIFYNLFQMGENHPEIREVVRKPGAAAGECVGMGCSPPHQAELLSEAAGESPVQIKTIGSSHTV